MKTTKTEAIQTNATDRPYHMTVLSRLPGELAECMVMAENGICIASVKATTNELAEANAALICKAVNSHDALIEALEETETSLSNALHTQDMNEQVKSVFDINLHYIRAALQQVKGGE